MQKTVRGACGQWLGGSPETETKSSVETATEIYNETETGIETGTNI